jgi:hypothetical protein
VCVNGAHLLEQHPHKSKPPVHAHAKPRVVEPDRATATLIRSPPKTITSATKSKTKSKAASKQRETPVSSPKSTPPASPAPQGSVEFGPGNVGSGSASRQPAAAPANGGGEFTP